MPIISKRREQAMENFKMIYLKYEDSDLLVEELKGVMDDYDMSLNGIEENRYIFDKDRSYFRSFIIDIRENGWISITDDDESQTDTLSLEMSDALSCFVICAGIQRGVLFYNAYKDGEQVGQYLSSLKYYEYQVDDDVISAYSGDASIFESIIDTEGLEKLQEVLNSCREGDIDSEEAFKSFLITMGIIEDMGGNDDEDDEEKDDNIEITDLFYVDFNSISVRINDRDQAVEAIGQIVEELGFIKVDNFDESSSGRKGLFKKIINSISESKRMLFYVSPSSDGWVTLIGEIERLMGKEATNWEFVHIEDRLSDILSSQVVNIFADNEHWGFKVFNDGKVSFSYKSTSEEYDRDKLMELFPGTDSDSLFDILDRTNFGVEEINDNFEAFCSVLNIKNAKINIPMDYTEEEFFEDVISKLPGCDGFLSLKFVEDK